MNQLQVLKKSRIYTITRNNQQIAVVLDRDLGEYFGIEAKNVNKAATRNKNLFLNKTFKLTKEEYQIILDERSHDPNLQDKETFAGGFLPTAYTEAGALSLPGVLRSAKSDEVFDMLINSFFAFRELIKNHPELTVDPQVYNARHEIEKIKLTLGQFDKRITASEKKDFFVIHNSGQLQIGNNNTQNTHGFTDLARLMTELLDHPSISGNPEYEREVKEVAIQALNKDKKGLLEKTESVVNIVNSITELSIKASPVLLPLLSWLKTLL